MNISITCQCQVCFGRRTKPRSRRRRHTLSHIMRISSTPWTVPSTTGLLLHHSGRQRSSFEHDACIASVRRRWRRVAAVACRDVTIRIRLPGRHDSASPAIRCGDVRVAHTAAVCVHEVTDGGWLDGGEGTRDGVGTAAGVGGAAVAAVAAAAIWRRGCRHAAVRVVRRLVMMVVRERSGISGGRRRRRQDAAVVRNSGSSG